MTFEFDKEYEKKRSSTVYKEELEAIEKVLAGEHENVCFTYESVRLAINAWGCLRKIKIDCKLKIKAMRRKNLIFVERIEKNGQKKIS